MHRAHYRLATILVILAFGCQSATAGDSRFPMLSNADAWAVLPATDAGRGGPLPNWARATARSLPRTTAAMIDLDRLHRTRSPLGSVLRAKMRWVAADANHCDYTRATAEADLRRDGVDEDQIADLKAGYDRWPVHERSALEFARQMTVNAGVITDPEVAEIVREHGESKLVAMVLLLAAANFQDRLVLSLGVPLEEGGPLPPLNVQWVRDEQQKPLEVPRRAVPDENAGGAIPTKVDDPSWAAFAFDALQQNMETQRANHGRVRVPSNEEVVKGLPAGIPAPKNPIRIKWTLVCMGYQPELAQAWSACTSRFQDEAKQDRIFEESLFWVVTRTITCFY